MTHQAEWLRRVAVQCQEEGKTSWANTCEMVANDIVAKDAELARLREHNQRLQVEISGLREESARLDWIHANLGELAEMIATDDLQLEVDIRAAIDAARGAK